MTTTETIRDLQEEVNRALLCSDWATLDRLVAADARIVGPRGFMISRDEWIDAHRTGDYEQGRLETGDTEVFGYDNTGVRIDLVESECRYKGETITGRFRVMQTWATRDGDWQLVGLQYTTVAA